MGDFPDEIWGNPPLFFCALCSIIVVREKNWRAVGPAATWALVHGGSILIEDYDEVRGVIPHIGDYGWLIGEIWRISGLDWAGCSSECAIHGGSSRAEGDSVVVTNADAKRVLRQVQSRAARGRTKLAAITRMPLKQVDIRSIERILQFCQDAAGEIKTALELLERLIER
jgi:hypothetical protein